MGDRGNIVVKSGDSTVYLYTHWRGSDLPVITKMSMKSERARNRWEDAYYLARILFQDLMAGDESEYGFGISSQIGDGVDKQLIINVDNQTVQWISAYDKSNKTFTKTFEEFVNDTGFKSSAVQEISYTADGILKVQFTSSDVMYTFKGVPSIVHEEFVSAKSKGKYFANNIRGKYLADENEYI